MSARRLRVARDVVAAVVIVDLLGIGLLAVRPTETTRTTSTPVAGADVVQAAPALPAPSAPALPSVAAALGPASAGVPLAAPAADLDAPAATPSAAPSAPASSPSSSPSQPSQPSDPSDPGDADAQAVFKACPVPLPSPGPQDDGGLRSIVPLAPAFGPFSAEAFAPASAYQPFLQVLGPLLARYPQLHEDLAPALDPLVKAFGTGAQGLFDLVEPLYGPRRQQFVQQLANLGDALAPLSEQAAYSPIGGCLVALQAAILPD